MVTIDLDLEKLINDLPESERQGALEALLTCDVDVVYQFLRQRVSMAARMALDLGWMRVTAEQKAGLRELLQRAISSDFASTK